MSFFKEHKFAIGIFALALAMRLFYLGVSLQANDGNLANAISGADGYFTISQNLIDGHGLTDSEAPPYKPYSFRPPLFHYFLAGAYLLLGGWWGAILLYIAIGSLLPILGMRIASYLTENKYILMALGVVLALEPSAILYSTTFYSETFFMLWFFLALWALFEYMRSGRFLHLGASAFLLGLSALTRPTSEYLPVIVIGALLFFGRRQLSRRHLYHLAGYAAIFVLVLAPWLYRNWTIWGVADLSPQMGVNLHMTLLPTVYSIERGTTFQQEFSALEKSGIKGPNNADLKEGEEYKKKAIPLLLAHPKALALSAVNSEISFFMLDGVFDFLRHIKIRPPEMLGKPSLAALTTDPAGFVQYFGRNIASPLALILLGRLIWIGITVAFLVAVWRQFFTARFSLHARVAVLVVLYFALTALITGYGLTARYRLPVNVFVIIFALCEVAAAAPWLIKKARRLHA